MLPVRGAQRLSEADILAVRPGAWIEERLNANTVSCKRTEEVAFGRPRKVVALLHRGWTRKGRWYANVLVAFGDGQASISLVEGDVRFRVREQPVDEFDLARYIKGAELSTEIADL